jgi:hypothetical protein
MPTREKDTLTMNTVIVNADWTSFTLMGIAHEIPDCPEKLKRSPRLGMFFLQKQFGCS